MMVVVVCGGTDGCRVVGDGRDADGCGGGGGVTIIWFKYHRFEFGVN